MTFVLDRRKLLAGAGAAIAGTMVPRTSRAAEFTMKLGHDNPESHSIHKRVMQAVDAIREETAGAVEIQVFSNSQLGSSVDMFSQLRSGALELQIVGTPLGNTIPTASINAVAFAFQDVSQAYTAMDGDLGKLIRETVSERLGIVPFDRVWDYGGLRHVTNSRRPIEVPADFEGLKLRVPVTPLYNSTFSALGASPVAINFGEVYSALQTKVADGQENPLALIEAGRFYEVQDYCSLTGHIWEAATLVANGRIWSGIPADMQAVIASHMNEMAVQQRADVAAQNAAFQEQLGAKGLAFNEVDRDPFRTALHDAGYYAEWQETFGAEAWAQLQAYAPGLG